MYCISDKKSYIKELQKYLNAYAEKIGSLSMRVPIDGIMGEKTRSTLKAFQRDSGLTSSGTVDRITHSCLVEMFRKELVFKNISKHVITPEGFPLRKNMQGSDVMTLNMIIEELANTYENVTDVNRVRYFDKYTERAVRDLQKIFGFEITGEVDALLFDRLKNELSISNRANTVLV